MQIIDLNLASRQFKNETLPWVLFVLAVGFIGFISWWNVSSYIESRSATTELLAREETIKRRLSDLKARQTRAFSAIDRSDLDSVLLRTDKANEVIRWKSFSWTRLFNVLQEVQPNDVQMVSINPVFHGNANSRRRDGIDPELVPISVEGVCKNLRDFFEFQTNLLFDRRIHSVEPDRWSTDEKTGQTEFSMRFLYDPRIDGSAEAEAQPEASVAAAEMPEVPTDTERDSSPAVADGAQPDQADLAPGAAAAAATATESLAAGSQTKIHRKGDGKARRGRNKVAENAGQGAAGDPVSAADGPPKLVKPFGQPSDQSRDLAVAGSDGGDS